MNSDWLKGQWPQVKGEVKNQWGKLTDDDLMRIEGNTEKLIGSIQQRYGYERARAEEEVRRWESQYASKP
jgi:uncharacterized protein YjbJ (UPF0337 family)